MKYALLFVLLAHVTRAGAQVCQFSGQFQIASGTGCVTYVSWSDAGVSRTSPLLPLYTAANGDGYNQALGAFYNRPCVQSRQQSFVYQGNTLCTVDYMCMEQHGNGLDGGGRVCTDKEWIFAYLPNVLVNTSTPTSAYQWTCAGGVITSGVCSTASLSVNATDSRIVYGGAGSFTTAATVLPPPPTTQLSSTTTGLGLVANNTQGCMIGLRARAALNVASANVQILSSPYANELNGGRNPQDSVLMLSMWCMTGYNSSSYPPTIGGVRDVSLSNSVWGAPVSNNQTNCTSQSVSCTATFAINRSVAANQTLTCFVYSWGTNRIVRYAPSYGGYVVNDTNAQLFAMPGLSLTPMSPSSPFSGVVSTDGTSRIPLIQFNYDLIPPPTSPSPPLPPPPPPPPPLPPL